MKPQDYLMKMRSKKNKTKLQTCGKTEFRVVFEVAGLFFQILVRGLDSGFTVRIQGSCAPQSQDFRVLLLLCSTCWRWGALIASSQNRYVDQAYQALNPKAMAFRLLE